LRSSGLMEVLCRSADRLKVDKEGHDQAKPQVKARASRRTLGFETRTGPECSGYDLAMEFVGWHRRSRSRLSSQSKLPRICSDVCRQRRTEGNTGS